jgi:hypothetical protein
MKVTTIVRFKDLKENVIREIGDEFEVSDTRLKEILDVGEFVRVIGAEDTTEEVDLSKLTNGKLKEILDEKGIEYKKNMTKGELIELIGE